MNSSPNVSALKEASEATAVNGKVLAALAGTFLGFSAAALGLVVAGNALTKETAVSKTGALADLSGDAIGTADVALMSTMKDMYADNSSPNGVALFDDQEETSFYGKSSSLVIKEDGTKDMSFITGNIVSTDAMGKFTTASQIVAGNAETHAEHRRALLCSFRSNGGNSNPNNNNRNLRKQNRGRRGAAPARGMTNAEKINTAKGLLTAAGFLLSSANLAGLAIKGAFKVGGHLATQASIGLDMATGNTRDAFQGYSLSMFGTMTGLAGCSRCGSLASMAMSGISFASCASW